MGLDSVRNFAKGTVSQGYASGVTSIVLSTGDGAKFPNPGVNGDLAFPLVWWNYTDYADPSDDPSVEIVRCTARTTDTLTIVRAQEGTADVNHNTGGKTYKVILALTAKMITDINTAGRKLDTLSGTNKMFWATGLTGGGDALDGIDGNDLTVGDGVFALYNDGVRDLLLEYRVQASGATESSPGIIAPDSNAGTKRLHLVSITPNEIDVRGFTTIDAAVTAIGSVETTLVVCDARTLGGDVTIPSTLVPRIVKGGVITIGTGLTLTINGPFEAGLYKVFNCTGTGKVVFGSGTVKEVYPQWWGTGTANDHDGFEAAFACALTGHLRVYIPSGTYAITGGLDLGYNSTGSIEYGNFIVEGSGKGTVLSFTISDTSTPAINIASSTTKMTIKNLFLKSTVPNKGIGVYAPGSGMTLDFDGITAYDFYTGFDVNIYTGSITNCIAGYGNTGFKINASTGLKVKNSYAMGNTAIGAEAWAGVGWYIGGGAYSSLDNCASDSNVTAYKFYSIVTDSDYSWSMVGCGMESNTNPIYIDMPTLTLLIENPSTDNSLIAYIENARNIIIDSMQGSENFTATRNATKVGVGVIRFVHTSMRITNPTLIPGTATTIDRSVWGINDLAYSIIGIGASDGIQEGRMIYRGNSLEIKLYALVEGDKASMTVNVEPYRQYDLATARGGTVTAMVFNNSGITKISVSTNALIKITETVIGTTGYVFLIEPFDSLTNPTAHLAIFTVTVHTSDVVHNHNIITAGTYTGRTTVKLNGVDY